MPEATGTGVDQDGSARATPAASKPQITVPVAIRRRVLISHQRGGPLNVTDRPSGAGVERAERRCGQRVPFPDMPPNTNPGWYSRQPRELKLDAHNRAALVVFAYETGLVRPRTDTSTPPSRGLAIA